MHHHHATIATLLAPELDIKMDALFLPTVQHTIVTELNTLKTKVLASIKSNVHFPLRIIMLFIILCFKIVHKMESTFGTITINFLFKFFFHGNFKEIIFKK